MRRLFLAAFAAALVWGAGRAIALPATFFGEDAAAFGDRRFDGAPAAARDRFLAHLTGSRTEDFEGFATGAGRSPLRLPDLGVEATLSGSGSVERDRAYFGRYAASGSAFYEASGPFEIAFDRPVTAFGFTGIDIGDFGGGVSVTAWTEDGAFATYDIPRMIDGRGALDGAILFWGLIDAENPFVKLVFGAGAAGYDVFGLDDMVIGSVGGGPSPVPLPAAGLLLASGLAGIAGLRRRRRAGPACALTRARTWLNGRRAGG